MERYTTLDPSAQRLPALNIEQEELRGIARTVAEIHWLLLILVLVYRIFGGSEQDDEMAITAALLAYAAFVMIFRYANFYREESRGKIAIESWGMIAFVTWVVWHTGQLTSPLLNAYLLPIITAALTLGKIVTLIEVALIASCYLFLGSEMSTEKLLSLSFYGAWAAQLAPMLVVAYVTTMFSADIRYGLAKARRLSESDELTGLYNRRGFAIAADRLFGQAQRYGRPASLLVIDSDNLKTVNDNHGHEAGNRLLRQLAQAIRNELRTTDVPARSGGDEFIVLLPETPSKGALQVAERIRDAVAAAPIEVDGKRVATSVSIGAASYPEDGNSLDSLAARADRAMYEAKQHGRNRVVRFAPGC